MVRLNKYLKKRYINKTQCHNNKLFKKLKLSYADKIDIQYEWKSSSKSYFPIIHISNINSIIILQQSLIKRFISMHIHQFANCLESKGHQYNTRDHTTEGTQNSEAQTNRQTARRAGTKHTKMCWTSTGSSTLSGVWGTHIALLQDIIHVLLLDLQLSHDLPIILSLIQPPTGKQGHTQESRGILSNTFTSIWF